MVIEYFTERMLWRGIAIKMGLTVHYTDTIRDIIRKICQNNAVSTREGIAQALKKISKALGKNMHYTDTSYTSVQRLAGSTTAANKFQSYRALLQRYYDSL